ncbi:formate dehydrogenase subunit gamma [Rubrivivax gelatinosus]|uniref:Formate dehydrogenase subunit gamma n=1 Tax=Rubrivivax gelatinosus TaxID=28068 RepID=A0ABS1DTL7_RUBGE|nr:formate dehydrogenase subunit gamma [Rubrivivax gelatinosus]MBK1613270.1 formate dehydrogenase subunit gamma [Rubrivivax gelatinosus]MBK1713364.1 formate dehydrogenase subunit gamma [Rubrivivax gelatinosus]
MRRNPRDIKRYDASERANHWAVGWLFLGVMLSGLAFFHPALFPLTMFFGGPTWARILHPYIGVGMALLFALMAWRFWKLNVIGAADVEWLRNVGKMVDGDDHDMPAQGKYNGGQKVLFWALVVCMAVMLLTGIPMWRAWLTLPVGVVRVASLLHAVAGIGMILLIVMHAYAAIWTRGTIRAMFYGTVTRAWAKQHHRNWYRSVTGDDS